MLIHVVKPGETIQSIANDYEVPLTRLILDNGLNTPYQLVTGQCIVIANAKITYTVKQGDTLIGIASYFNVEINQILINNPFLMEKQYIYPGQTLVIAYPKKGKITTHGNTVPYIDIDTLKKTLPYLTYLSVLNYTATKEGEIITYNDDTDIIKTAKEYGVVPLMLLTTLTIQGEADIRTAYDILLNETFQNKQIDNILKILKTKGYKGINISFEYISISNFKLYETYFTKIEKRLKDEGYLVFVTINTNITNIDNQIYFERVDYTILGQLANNIIFMNYEWATNINPPSPISSIYNINAFLEYAGKLISLDRVIIGLATIGYDWELPYSAGLSRVYPLTLERAVDLARNKEVIIQFDEKSQTPFYKYMQESNGRTIEHIVWFIDARSINSLLDLVMKYKLHGIGIFNITIYNPQLWLVINSQFDIEKIK
ncbi:LysM peptidoglycan-binding domain-containing protein [Anaeromicropila herbilytica]|uniref:Germination protein n=1 Tax=Anaeromicropila herbilytica TaxID=2785025 RepID=A0A7R7EPZ8_9FIRM|nr:LysM peptidoglycan-binding domain-containing protein [Anaeromicropila herbilytica]BCN32671.1 germination protein [Anaeromicropila herbilytica]